MVNETLDNSRKKSVKWLKITFRVLLISVVVAAVLLIGSAIFLYNNQDKMKSVVVTELNRSLKSEISVQEIDFTFFKSFPFASLRFKNVLGKEVYNPYQEKDTLFYAERILLKFNLLDICRGNYQIKQMDIRNAGFYMKYFADSVPNYEFWKTNEGKTNSNFKFSLQKIQFQNARYLFHNEVTKQHYDIFIKNGTANGDFSAVNQAIQLNGDLNINLFQTNNLILFKKTSVKVSVDFLHKSVERTIFINSGDLNFNKLPFSGQGSFCYAKDSSNINVDIKSKQIELNTLIQFLPAQLKKAFDGYKSTGTLDIAVNISEQMNLKKLPSVSAKFNIQNGSFSGKNVPVQFQKINLSGTFKNGKKRSIETYSLQLNNLSAQINQGSIKGNLSIQNFKNPDIDAKLSANLNLVDIHNFLKNEQIEYLNGFLLLDINLKGSANNIKEVKAYALNQVNINGTANLKNTNIKVKNYKHAVKNMQSTLVFNNQKASLENTNLRIGESDIKLNGSITNILPFLFLKNESLNIFADVGVNQLLLEDFIPTKSTKESEEKQKSVKSIFFNNIQAKASLSIGKFVYKNIKAQNVKALIEAKPNAMSITNVKMNALKGELGSDLYFNNLKENNGTFKISGNVDLKTIDVKELFTAFNNFGQTALTSDNLEGNITAGVTFSTLYNLEKGVDSKSLKVISDTKIENGALLNFKPFSKLSYFVDDETLKNIRFCTLTNVFQIQNEVIEIPRMEIKSNVLNFEISGKHKFNKEINYNLKMKLSELSSKKQKARLVKEQKEFGSFEEDNSGRMTLYISVTGTLDNPVFKYDSKSAKIQLKENIKAEKENLKNVLKNEFSGSETDKQDKANWKKQEKGEYIIDWEERKDTTAKTKQPKKETKFNIDWE